MAYSAPEYDEQKYKQGIDTSYYTDAIQKYTDAQEKNRATQTAQAAKQQENALRDAYVSKMQNQKNLNENLARAGIRGGATETSNLKLANTYASQRNAANSDYANSVNSINQSIDSNILNYDMDMTSRAEEYRQNLSQAKWQAAREDYANAIAQQNWEAEFAQNAAIANAQQKLAEAQYNYQISRDEIEDARYDTEYADTKKQNDLNYEQQKFENELAGWQRTFAGYKLEKLVEIRKKMKENGTKNTNPAKWQAVNEAIGNARAKK